MSSELDVGRRPAELTKQVGKPVVLLPSEANFTALTKVYNRAVPIAKPAAAVQCRSAGDVVDAVHYAKSASLKISVKSSGHNFSGLAVRDDTLLIDVSNLDQYHIDVHQKRARVGPGLRGCNFVRALQPHGLAFPIGHCSTVALGGFCLGGGIGWGTRLFGTGSDNILSARIVTADGNLRTASEAENPELLWALRGAGTFFGVVVEMTLKLHDVPSLCVDAMAAYPGDVRAAAARFLRDQAHRMPAEVEWELAMVSAPDGAPMAVLQTPTFTTPERASSLLQPLRDFMPEKRLAYAETPTAFADICTGHDAGFPDETHGFYVYGGMLRPPLADGLIDGLVELMSRPPSPQSLVLMFTLPRSSNIAAGALKMHDRVNICLIACWSSTTPESERPRFKAWIDEGRRLLRSFGDVRMYIHESTLSGSTDIRSAFDDAAWNRIKALKAQLDGDGVFLPLDYYCLWC